jgi:hypothetical protein
VSDSTDVHVRYRVTCSLGQKEATSKWPDVVMTVCNGVYVTQHEVLIIKNQKDRQRTYDVTLRRIPATVVAVEQQYLLHILSV